MSDWKYFRQLNSRSSAPRVWEIKVEGNVIHTRWGMFGGAMQEAKDIMKGVNLGKKNEIGPDAYAQDRAEEIIRKKKREGYREFDSSGKCVEQKVDTKIDFTNLSESLCFYKPDNTMGAGMLKKAEEGKVWYTRKRNGLMYVISKDSKGVVRLFSRRMLRGHDLQPDEFWEKRFPYIRDVADFLMPSESIMLGEIVFDMKGVDDFKMAQ